MYKDKTCFNTNLYNYKKWSEQNTNFPGRHLKIFMSPSLAAARIWALRRDPRSSSSSLFQLWVWLLYCLISELAWYQNICSRHGYKCCGSRWEHWEMSRPVTDLIWLFCPSYASELQTPGRAGSWTEGCWRRHHQESILNKHGWRVF